MKKKIAISCNIFKMRIILQNYSLIMLYLKTWLKLLQQFRHSRFFSFFLFIPFSGRNANVLRLVIKKRCDQDLTHSSDTPKNISLNIVPEVVLSDAFGTWHSLCTVTSIHSIQKTTRNSQKLWNKLTSRWLKSQGSKQRGIVLVRKKVWRKTKKKMFKIRNWLLIHGKQYKNC